MERVAAMLDLDRLGVTAEARFRLEPPEGWQAVAPSSPLMRAQLRHNEKDASLAVFIRQVQGDWDLSKGAGKPIQDEVTADLNARYARAGGARTLVGSLFDAPVVRVEWDVADSLPDSARGEGGFGHTGQ